MLHQQMFVVSIQNILNEIFMKAYLCNLRARLIYVNMQHKYDDMQLIFEMNHNNVNLQHNFVSILDNYKNMWL